MWRVCDGTRKESGSLVNLLNKCSVEKDVELLNKGEKKVLLCNTNCCTHVVEDFLVASLSDFLFLCVWFFILIQF